MFCCSFGEAPKYPFTPYIKDSVLLITPFNFSIHFSTKFLYSFKLFSIIFFLSEWYK